MTKKKLIQHIATKTDLDYSQVQQVLDLAFERILNRLKFGENVKMHEFASFKIETTKKSKKYNFQTKENEIVPPHYRVKVEFPRPFQEFIRNKTCYDGTED